MNMKSKLPNNLAPHAPKLSRNRNNQNRPKPLRIIPTEPYNKYMETGLKIGVLTMALKNNEILKLKFRGLVEYN